MPDKGFRPTPTILTTELLRLAAAALRTGPGNSMKTHDTNFVDVELTN